MGFRAGTMFSLPSGRMTMNWALYNRAWRILHSSCQRVLGLEKGPCAWDPGITFTSGELTKKFALSIQSEERLVWALINDRTAR